MTIDTSPWKLEQDRIRDHVISQDDNLSFSIDDDGTIVGLERVGGIDISCVPETNLTYVAITILSFPSLALLRLECEPVEIDIPYIPGFLAFREMPAIRRVLGDLLRRLPEGERPQVFLVDGNGQMHPRGAGIASHLGVDMDLPTIGCSKSFFRMDGLTEKIVTETVTKGLIEQDRIQASAPIVGKSGCIHGYALLNGKKKQTKNPIFVSIGHRVGLETALAVVKAVSVYRVPEPIRLADKLSREKAQSHITII